MTGTIEKQENPDELDIQFCKTLSPNEQQGIEAMQKEVFGASVSEREACEDFINVPYAHILVKKSEKIIGNLDLHHSIGKYEEMEVSIGGLSIGIIEKYRKHGLGGRLISMAMEYIKNQDYDLGFLAAAPGTIPLYEKYGWRVLNVPYTWENVYGEIKSDTDGMIVPLRTPQLVEKIQKGNIPLHVGRGYW